MPLVALGVIGGVASAAIGAHAAGSAADAQVSAANNAANLQHQDAQAALDFQKQQYGNSLRLLEPYYGMGTSALDRLGFLMGIRPQGLPSGVTTPGAPAVPGMIPRGFPMTALSADDGPMRAAAFNGQMPRLDANPGQGALSPDDPGATNAAPGQVPLQNPDIGRFAPSGPLVANGSPGQVPRTDLASAGTGDFGFLAQPWSENFQAPTDVTEQNDPGYRFRLNEGMKALQTSAAAKGNLFSGDTLKGLNDYAQNSASSEYGNVYNRAFNDYITRYNQFKQNQNDIFNRFTTLAGLGQTTAGQLSNTGLTTGQNISNTLLTSGDQIGRDYLAAGNARGSGYINTANAVNSGINNLFSLYALMNKGSGGVIPWSEINR